MIQNEGPGWRMSRDPDRGQFPVLIGGEGWAFELTEMEWSGLVTIIFELQNQHDQMYGQLMPEESICLEFEQERWWGCLEGDRDDWSLQVVLQAKESGIRGLEVHWPKKSARAFSEAVRNIWDSYH